MIILTIGLTQSSKKLLKNENNITKTVKLTKSILFYISILENIYTSKQSYVTFPVRTYLKSNFSVKSLINDMVDINVTRKPPTVLSVKNCSFVIVSLSNSFFHSFSLCKKFLKNL